jgi:hypothetical protein
MDELDSEQKCQLNKMLERYYTHETMTPQIGDIYLFSSLDGKKRAVYCDSKTFSVFKAHTQEEEYIDDGCYRKRRFRK